MAKKILIAEDDANIVASVEFLLRHAGYELRIARDGDEALRAVGEFLPDLVLLDVMMPLRNGFEVCQKIRENAQWRHIKIVMLTAKGRQSEISKGMALGADAYLLKPFATADLLEQVGRQLHAPG
jgi:two-component system, OmpR family, alkaline phosphatase synthesis response regulator PhoP